MSDFRAALRALQKSPAFTLVAVITIAVGIGANTTLFSVYDRLVLNPVTIPHPSSLVAIWTNNPQLNFNAPALSWSRYEDIRDHARSFASVGISAFDNFTLTGNGEPAAAQWPARQRHVLSDARHPAGARPQLHRRRRPAQRSGGLHHQPRAVADALRRPRRRSSATTSRSTASRGRWSASCRRASARRSARCRSSRRASSKSAG